MTEMAHALLLGPSPVLLLNRSVYHVEIRWQQRMYSEAATLKGSTRRHWMTSRTAYACGELGGIKTCSAGSRIYRQVLDVVEGVYRRWEDQTEGSLEHGRSQSRAV